jgi:hypothetical protein
MVYDQIYYLIYKFANYRIEGVLLCRLLAPLILLIIVWISRIIQSVMVKFFAVCIAALLYFLPTVVRLFYG